MPLSVGNLLLGSACQPTMSAIASSYASGKQDILTFGYDTSNKITSIDGSAIVGEGAGDTSQCFPASASGMLQPSGNYLSATESSNYYSTSNPSGFISGVDLTPYQLTADMSAYQHSGNYLSSTDSSEFLLTSQSGLFQPSGNYQVSGNYLSATESSNYYSTSNPSGFITGMDLTNYATTAYVDSSVSSKLDATASSQFLTSVPDGYATTSDLSSLIAYSALSGSDNTITSISGSAIGGIVPPTSQLMLDDATMSGLIDPLTQDFFIGVKSGVFAMDSGMTAYATTTYVDSAISSSVSSKLDASSFTSYTATSMPVVIVGNSSEATAANVVYVVTGVSV